MIDATASEGAASSSDIEQIDRRLLLLSSEDNVVVACTNLGDGEAVRVDGALMALHGNAPIGFKIARRDLAPGEKVVKYGAAIGSVTTAIRRGEVVHLHNMQSDYLPTYVHGDGAGFTKR
jgi:altronate dehydratase small subunit